MIRYDVIGLAKTRRHRPFNAVYDTGEEMFLGTCDIRGVGGVGVIINTSLSMNIDSFEQLTTRIGRLRLKRCGSTPALTIFVVYAPTSNYDKEEVEAFYMELERFYREDHTFFKVIHSSLEISMPGLDNEESKRPRLVLNRVNRTLDEVQPLPVKIREHLRVYGVYAAVFMLENNISISGLNRTAIRWP
uniref:Uncharacterized protein n=1 Tax=Angiostrongylus cantonensis TaxID=6313 RepID=A0A158P667_ANGCA